MGNGTFVIKSSLRKHGNLVAMKRQNSQVFEAGKGCFLDTLESIVAYNQGG